MIMSKGFFMFVFNDMEDIDKIFRGVYFVGSVGVFMNLWIERFELNK